MVSTDSLDKIVTRYFACVTNVPFEWRGKIYSPKPLRISPGLLRGYTCPPNCGACCPRFSLDYLPDEPQPTNVEKRTVIFDGRQIEVHSDLQLDHSDRFCRHVLKENARCNAHPTRPFTCDFELIRPLLFAEPHLPNVLTQKLYGRGWCLMKVNGVRGALCEMIPVSDETIDDVVRKIQRLNDWCVHFGLTDTKCEAILTWIQEVRPHVKHWRIDGRVLGAIEHNPSLY